MLYFIFSRGRPDMDKWEESKNLDFITEAGWYFKTLAAQEPGKTLCIIHFEPVYKNPPIFLRDSGHVLT